MGEPNYRAYPSASYTPNTHNDSTPGRLPQMAPPFPGSSEISRDRYSTGDIVTSGCPSGLGVSEFHQSNGRSITETTGVYVRRTTIDELAAELASGAELQSAILAREGYHCLLWPEYQFEDYKISLGTPFRVQNIDLHQYEASPPSSSDSPDSVFTENASSTSPKSQGREREIGSERNYSLKRFKCPHPSCSYAADRQDHVKDHYQARHLGIYYTCGECTKKYVYKGDFESHSPCKSQGKELNTKCLLCGAIVIKKGLRRHQETKKCKDNQITWSSQ